MKSLRFGKLSIKSIPVVVILFAVFFIQVLIFMNDEYKAFKRNHLR